MSYGYAPILARWGRTILGTVLLFVTTGCRASQADALGNIDGVRFRVPVIALLSGMSSDVDAAWKPPSSETNSYDRRIAYFDLMLTLPSMRYARESEEQSVNVLKTNVSNYEWITKGHKTADRFQAHVKGNGAFGPYGKAPTVFGLKHWALLHPPKSAVDVTDILYDLRSDTLFECVGQSLTELAGTWGSCDFMFDIDTLHVNVSGTFDRHWLPKWKDVRVRLTHKIKTFVVR